MSEPSQPYETLADVAKRLGVPYETARRWTTGIRVGTQTVTLRHEPVGARIRIPVGAVEEFQRSCRAARGSCEPFAPPPSPDAEAERGRRATAEALAALDSM